MHPFRSLDPRAVSARRLTAVIHTGFVLTGVVTTLLGPMIPTLSAQWSLNDSQTGSLFTAQFVGSMMGVTTSSAFMSRLGFLRSLRIGFSLLALGVFGVAVSHRAWGYLSILIYGIGLGIVIPVSNLLISEVNSTRRAAALNLLNFSWGLGAVASPLLIALLVRGENSIRPLHGLSLLLAGVVVWLWRYRAVRFASRSNERTPLQTAQGSLLRNPFLLLIGALLFLYVGTENAVAGWVASYALRLPGQAQSLWALAPSIFWMTLLIGRATAPVLLRHVAEDKLVLIGLVMAAGGATFLLTAKSISGLLVAVGFAGAGLASVLPTTVALLPRCFGALASKVAGLVFASAGLGGATLPWAVGLLSTHFGSLRVGLLVPLMGTLAMITLQLVIISALFRARSVAEPLLS